MAKIFIKPAVDGHIVRHPEKLQYIIPAEGEYVEDNIQWQRYLRHGDVVVVQPTSSQFDKPKSRSNKEGE